MLMILRYYLILMEPTQKTKNIKIHAGARVTKMIKITYNQFFAVFALNPFKL